MSGMVASPLLLTFPGTLEGLEATASRLREILDARGIDGGPRYNVELAFEEIAANIVRHGSPVGDVVLVLTFDDDLIVLSFEDDGVPFNPVERPDPALPASIDDAPVGGLGVMLVRKASAWMWYQRTPEARNHLTLAIRAR